MKISQAKLNIQIIITNLKQLETHRYNLSENNLDSESAEIAKWKECLEEAFASLEREPMWKVAAQLKRRKTKRANRTKRLKMKKSGEPSSNSKCKLSDLFIPKQKPLHALMKGELRSANKYLSIIRSLESLHQLRGGGDSCKLRESLNPIQSIWHSIAQRIEAEEQNSTSTEMQWDQVLFGGNSETEMKYGYRDLVERRCIWDSYLVSQKNETGSNIPIGWIYPKADARPEWKQFNSL